jgi:hypothetical protein
MDGAEELVVGVLGGKHWEFFVAVVLQDWAPEHAAILCFGFAME